MSMEGVVAECGEHYHRWREQAILLKVRCVLLLLTLKWVVLGVLLVCPEHVRRWLFTWSHDCHVTLTQVLVLLTSARPQSCGTQPLVSLCTTQWCGLTTGQLAWPNG